MTAFTIVAAEDDSKDPSDDNQNPSVDNQNPSENNQNPSIDNQNISDKNGAGSGNGSKITNTKGTAKTGDSTSVLPFVAAALAAAFVIVGTVLYKRKRIK